MRRDRPDSDQERRLSKGNAPLPPNHPPGMETRGPGKEEMQELQESKREDPHSTNPTLCRQKSQTDAKFGEALSVSELPRDSAWVGVTRVEPATSSSAGSSPLPLIPTAPLCSAGVCAASSSLGSSLSSSAVQEPSLSGLACQAGTSPGCGPPGFMALISRQPDLDTAGSGSLVPMESATQEAAKPFLCARRKGALLACPGGQRES